MPEQSNSGTDQKPEWANWIEDDESPHLVTGAECRRCHSAVSGMDPTPPEEFPENAFIGFVHEDGCKDSDPHSESDRHE